MSLDRQLYEQYCNKLRSDVSHAQRTKHFLKQEMASKCLGVLVLLNPENEYDKEREARVKQQLSELENYLSAIKLAISTKTLVQDYSIGRVPDTYVVEEYLDYTINVLAFIKTHPKLSPPEPKKEAKEAPTPSATSTPKIGTKLAAAPNKPRAQVTDDKTEQLAEKQLKQWMTELLPKYKERPGIRVWSSHKEDIVRLGFLFGAAIPGSTSNLKPKDVNMKFDDKVKEIEQKVYNTLKEWGVLGKKEEAETLFKKTEGKTHAYNRILLGALHAMYSTSSFDNRFAHKQELQGLVKRYIDWASANKFSKYIPTGFKSTQQQAPEKSPAPDPTARTPSGPK